MSLPLSCPRHPAVVVSHLTELREIPECGVEADWWGIWSEEEGCFVFVSACPLEAADEFAARKGRSGRKGGTHFAASHRIRAVCASHPSRPSDGCPQCVQEEAEYEARRDAEQVLADERADWLEDVSMESVGYPD